MTVVKNRKEHLCQPTDSSYIYRYHRSYKITNTPGFLTNMPTRSLEKTKQPQHQPPSSFYQVSAHAPGVIFQTSKSIQIMSPSVLPTYALNHISSVKVHVPGKSAMDNSSDLVHTEDVDYTPYSVPAAAHTDSTAHSVHFHIHSRTHAHFHPQSS